VPVRGGGFLETRRRGGNATPLNVPSLIGRAREGSRETWLRIWLHSTRNLRPKSSRTYRRLCQTSGGSSASACHGVATRPEPMLTMCFALVRRRRGADETEWHRLNDDLRATYGHDLDSVTVHKEGSPALLLSPSLPYHPVLPGGRATTYFMPIPMEPGLSVSHSNSLHSSQPGGAFGGAVAPHSLNFSSIAQRISSLHDSPDGTSREMHVSQHPQAPSNAYPSARQSLSSIIREFREGPIPVGKVEPSANKAIGRAVWASSLQADSAQGTSSPR